MDALALASRLNVTAMAVRQHLYALQEEQLVTYQEESRSIALPSLSDKLTSLRGYSQRKIKVFPQTDGRGLWGDLLNCGS
jgi:DNA-binding transcriptional ArsR family regulator